MADQLYLSYWLKGFSRETMLRSLDGALRKFPLLPRNPSNAVLRIHAISLTEPTLLERDFTDPLQVSVLIAAAREFLSADAAFQLDTWWGLWQFEKDWALKPARVTIGCYGPEFEDCEGNLRIDLGPDIYYLPDPELAGSAYYAGSNLKSLLQLVQSLDRALPVEHRALWTESGDNFAEKIGAIIPVN